MFAFSGVAMDGSKTVDLLRCVSGELVGTLHPKFVTCMGDRLLPSSRFGMVVFFQGEGECPVGLSD